MTHLPTRRFLQLAAIATVGFLIAACGKKETPTTPAAAPVASAPAPARVYVVGTDAAYAPFESQNEKGEIVGFDIEVTKAIAAKAGIEVKFVNTPWEGIFNALAQGNIGTSNQECCWCPLPRHYQQHNRANQKKEQSKWVHLYLWHLKACLKNSSASNST